MTTITILDFWAPWCGQCTMLSKMLDQMESDLKGKATLKKVNVDETEGRQLAQNYSINRLPTMIFLKNDEEFARVTGVTTKASILKLIDDNAKDSN